MENEENKLYKDLTTVTTPNTSIEEKALSVLDQVMGGGRNGLNTVRIPTFTCQIRVSLIKLVGGGRNGLDTVCIMHMHTIFICQIDIQLLA